MHRSGKRYLETNLILQGLGGRLLITKAKLWRPQRLKKRPRQPGHKGPGGRDLIAWVLSPSIISTVLVALMGRLLKADLIPNESGSGEQAEAKDQFHTVSFQVRDFDWLFSRSTDGTAFGKGMHRRRLAMAKERNALPQ